MEERNYVRLKSTLSQSKFDPSKLILNPLASSNLLRPTLTLKSMKFSYRTSPTRLLLLAVLSSFFVLQSNFSHGVDLAIASEPLKSDTNVSLIPQPQNISLKEGAKLKLPPLITYSAGQISTQPRLAHLRKSN